MAESGNSNYKSDLIGDFNKESMVAAACGTLFYLTAVVTLLSYAAPILSIPNELKSVISLVEPCKGFGALATGVLGVLTNEYNKISIETVNQINKLYLSKKDS